MVFKRIEKYLLHPSIQNIQRLWHLSCFSLLYWMAYCKVSLLFFCRLYDFKIVYLTCDIFRLLFWHFCLIPFPIAPILFVRPHAFYALAVCVCLYEFIYARKRTLIKIVFFNASALLWPITCMSLIKFAANYSANGENTANVRVSRSAFVRATPKTKRRK